MFQIKDHHTVLDLKLKHNYKYICIYKLSNLIRKKEISYIMNHIIKQNVNKKYRLHNDK